MNFSLRRSLSVSALLLSALATLSSSSLFSVAPVAAQAKNPALQPCTVANTVSAIDSATVPAGVDKPVLIVGSTVAPITNLVYNIGGARIKLYGLVPEGADSHTFEPRPSAAATLSEVDVFFMNGLSLETPTRKLAEANLKSGAEIVDLGGQTLQESDWVYDFSFPKEQGDPNPHLWTNPLLALDYARIVRNVLSRRDPAGSAFYAANYAILAGRIATLDQAICDSIATIPAKNHKLLTYHDSWAYFSPRYGMTVIGAIQPSDFSEPSVQEVARIIDQIKAEGVPAIFGSEVFPSKILDQIGKEAGVTYIQTLADDDLPNQAGDRLYHSYLQLMVNNVTTMTAALGGDPAALKAVNTANLHGPDTAVENAR